MHPPLRGGDNNEPLYWKCPILSVKTSITAIVVVIVVVVVVIIIIIIIITNIQRHKSQ